MKTLEIRSTNYKFLLNSYREWLQIKGYCKKAVIDFPRQVKEFFHFLEQQNILHIRKIEPRHSAEFKLHLQYRINHKTNCGGISNSMINSILQSVNCFGTFVNETNEGFILDVYQDYLAVDTAEKVILTQEEIKALYMATYEPYKNVHGSYAIGERNRAMLAVFYSCGLRNIEGSSLNLSDIDFNNKRILVRNGKGNKERFVPIPISSLEDIRTYIQNGRNWFTEHHHQVNICYKYSKKKTVTKDNQEALFLNQTGKRMKRFENLLDDLVLKAGVTKKVGTHTLRHSLATHLCQNGMDIDSVAKILGHVAGSSATQIYVHIAEELKNGTYGKEK